MRYSIEICFQFRGEKENYIKEIWLIQLRTIEKHEFYDVPGKSPSPAGLKCLISAKNEWAFKGELSEYTTQDPG